MKKMTHVNTVCSLAITMALSSPLFANCPTAEAVKKALDNYARNITNDTGIAVDTATGSFPEGALTLNEAGPVCEYSRGQERVFTINLHQNRK